MHLSNCLNKYLGQKDLYFCQCCILKPYRLSQSNETVKGKTQCWCCTNSIPIVYTGQTVLSQFINSANSTVPVDFKTLCTTKVSRSWQAFMNPCKSMILMIRCSNELKICTVFSPVCVCVEALRSGAAPPKPRDRDRGQTRTNSPRN